MNLVELVLNIQVGSVVVRNGIERRSSWWSSERALGFELDDFLSLMKDKRVPNGESQSHLQKSHNHNKD